MFFSGISDKEKARRKARWEKRYPHGSPVNEGNDDDDNDPYEDHFYGDLNHCDHNHNGIADIFEDDDPDFPSSDDNDIFDDWNDD